MATILPRFWSPAEPTIQASLSTNSVEIVMPWIRRIKNQAARVSNNLYESITSAVTSAAVMATLRAPNFLAATGITDENSKMPSGIIAELIPIMSLATPRDSRISDSNG